MKRFNRRPGRSRPRRLSDGRRSTTRHRGTFVCSGSLANGHASLYFTPRQADKGCPHGCEAVIVHKDTGSEAGVH
ncbi:MAG: hypothetical protein HY420_02415 [Candidatus Kerfeldbacteria bacterium]|nr:hypothetical protein [Candidatus Kerfeldbacteria bacterium]